jgi:hypothetical protein
MPDSPVGTGSYVVEAGDCMSSIAEAHGHFWQTLWDLPENAELKKARGDPNVLLPGDRVTIPPIRVASVTCKTGNRYVFRRRGIPEVLTIAFRDADGQTLAGRKFELIVGSTTTSGTTGDGGVIRKFVPAAATGAILRIWPAVEGLPEMLEWTLRIGHLDPITTIRGVKARLENLGYNCGAIDDAEDDALYGAVYAFQTSVGLEASGAIDDATRAKLRELHDLAGATK